MVRRGQYLERAVVIPGPVPLEGLYHRGALRPGVLIAPPHPEEGGSMEHALIAELAWAATRAGHPTLRFNYRGVGASGGRFDPREALGDLIRARSHLAACVSGTEEAPFPVPPDLVTEVGLGFGAELVADLAARERELRAGAAGRLFLVAPRAERLPAPEALAGLRVVVVAAGEPEAPSRDPAGLRWVEALPGSRLHRVAGADAAFRRGLVEVGRLLAESLAVPG